MNKGFRQEEIDKAKAAADAAAAALEVIVEQKKELRIVAPLGGVIESLELQPGDLTAPGGPRDVDDQAGELWVRAYVPERLLPNLGQRVPVTLDASPGRFEGR